jgi:hypothetical protein
MHAKLISTITKWFIYKAFHEPFNYYLNTLKVVKIVAIKINAIIVFDALMLIELLHLSVVQQDTPEILFPRVALPATQFTAQPPVY